MNLYFRLIVVFFRSIFSLGTRTLNDAVEINLRVLPSDLDTNLHLSNSLYLSMMDLARVDLIIRTGLIKHVFKDGWQPMIGNAYLRFRKGLGPFEKFKVRSKIVSWDEKWVYIEQAFISQERVVAQGLVKGLFCKRGKPIPIKEMFETMDWEYCPPARPDWIEHLTKVDSAVSSLNTHQSEANLSA